jgi:integrase/recombinase XerD
MTKKELTLSQAIEGYFIYANARRLSAQTLNGYQWALNKFEMYLGADPPFASLTTHEVRTFLNTLPGLTNTSLIGVRAGLSALWSWGFNEGLVTRNIVKDTEAPKAEKREVIPFTQRELQLLLTACDRSKAYKRPGKRACENTRSTALRDRAIVILLVDTGIRASELCGLTLRDADFRNHRIVVMGKGRKERHVPISPRTEQALWRYLATREDKKPVAPLFATSTGNRLDRFSLHGLLELAGNRAGVEGVHPHRFRHTFAITFLRNGGNVFALQRILGHESLTMVNKYLAIAQTDIQAAHHEASPVMNWLL